VECGITASANLSYRTTGVRGVILHDHERRRRLATNALIDMVASMWPAQAALRDESNRLRSLRVAYQGTADDDERDRLSDAIVESCERMVTLVDLIAEQM
jgi:hypothetical protein